MSGGLCHSSVRGLVLAVLGNTHTGNGRRGQGCLEGVRWCMEVEKRQVQWCGKSLKRVSSLHK